MFSSVLANTKLKQNIINYKNMAIFLPIHYMFELLNYRYKRSHISEQITAQIPFYLNKNKAINLKIMCHKVFTKALYIEILTFNNKLLDINILAPQQPNKSKTIIRR